jgi:predicted metal-binding membrane protein
MLSARSDSRAFTLLALSLIGLAWAALLVWGGSPYGGYLHHEALANVRGVFEASFALRFALFVAGWALMTVAMMLPTSLPLVSLFRTMTSARPNKTRLIGLLIVGYVLVWTGFGAVAYLGDLGIHASVDATPWLKTHSWLITVAILLGAGAYQFSPMKYLCLEKCRSPYSFVMSHWHGQNADEEAMRLGLSHGAYCVGCCWSLMLLMFAVGMGNLAWMLGLAVAMGIEKNFAWGRKLTPILGVTLVTAGITALLMGAPPGACAC